MNDAEEPVHVRIGPFEVDSKAVALRRDGRPITIQELPFRLLLILIRRRGDVVTRGELCTLLWGDTVVEFDSGLNTAIRKLREALGDDPAHPTYIETVPRRGYRLRAVVESVDLQTPRTSRLISRSRMTAPSVYGVMAVLLVTTVVSLALWAGSSRLPTFRLLVLPVDSSDLGGDAYAPEGLTDDLIAHLGRLDPHRLEVLGPVTARAVRHAGETTASIAGNVGASHILAARLSRHASGVRLAVSLSRVPDGVVAWSEVYDEAAASWPTTATRLVTMVARAVARTLNLSKSEQLARAGTLNTSAYEAFLRGRMQWNRFNPDGFRASLTAFQTSAALDPYFADAHIGIAEAYAMLGLFQASSPKESFAKAAQSAVTALQHVPDHPDALAVLALARFYSQTDWPSAETSFERALSLDPGRALTHQWAAGYFAARGRRERALALARRAQRLEPLSPAVNADLCWYYYFAKKYADAAKEGERAITQFGVRGALVCGELAYRQLGDEFHERRLFFERLRRAGEPSSTLSELAGVFRTGGILALRRAQVDRLKSASKPSESYQLVATAIAANQPAFALQLLAGLADDPPPWLAFLAIDPSFDSVRQTLAFHAIAAKHATSTNTAP